MRVVTGVLVLTVAAGLTGCSGEEEPREAAPATSAPEPTGLRETCPEVEAALPPGLVPPASKWATYEQTLVELRDEGDTETENALDLLIPAVSDLADDPEPGMPILDARDALRDGLEIMRERCEAAGSSALQ